MCVFRGKCVFSPSCRGAPGQSVFTDGITEPAAQTAEVCSCGVPLTESYRDHIVWTQVRKYNGGFTQRHVGGEIINSRFLLSCLNPASEQWVVGQINH